MKVALISNNLDKCEIQQVAEAFHVTPGKINQILDRSICDQTRLKFSDLDRISSELGVSYRLLNKTARTSEEEAKIEARRTLNDQLSRHIAKYGAKPSNTKWWGWWNWY